MEKIEAKIKTLSNLEIIKISKELRSTNVPEDALVRELIKNTEFDNGQPLMAFLAVSGLLHFELADRLEILSNVCIQVMAELKLMKL
jgi:hypothetical protein